MRTTLYACVMLSLAGMAGCGDTVAVQSRSFRATELKSIKTVAVVDFAGDSGGQAFADMLSMELMQAGYRVVERDNLRRVLDEQKMASEGTAKLDVTEKERLSVIGKNIAADLIITGELVRLVPARYERENDTRVKFPPATCEVTARAVDSKTGKVIWTCVVNVTATAKDGQYVKPLDYINEACAELVLSLNDPKYGNKNVTFMGSQIQNMRKTRPWGS